MPFDLHTVEVVDGSNIQNQDKVLLAMQNAVANAAGTAAGSTVTTAVAFTGYELPAAYTVVVTPNQNCQVSVTNKTNNGFNVNLYPMGVSGQLTAGGTISTGAATITMAATVPQWVVAGMNVYDVTKGAALGTVASIATTVLTMAANSASAGTGSADVLQFGFMTVASGTFDVAVFG